MQELLYNITENQHLYIAPGVYKHITTYRQSEPDQKEAGGQLFAIFSKNKVSIEFATGVNKSDKRGRLSFLPSLWHQKKEIKQFYKKGFHYIGEWHTHPEPYPMPSSIDIQSMQKSFQKSKHDLQWFIMIILGQDESDKGLSVNIVNQSKCITLNRVNTY